MQERLYVIAARGRNGVEVYLKCSDRETKNDVILMEWTKDIEDAYAVLTVYDAEKYARSYFKNYKKWYIKSYVCEVK